ncbi:hypothetical protein [Halonotius roseus]|uniref:hypothetical protein n=1 Tax=Halonotius roseus TaxID=2511997 RepID=UPI00163BD073|nr:hypothetical protein [Halonotius roseus]
MTPLVPVVAVTVVAHAVLAVAVVVHARRTNRDPGYWLPATLLFGLIGVAGYLWSR